jgi:hypothetical protein
MAAARIRVELERQGSGIAPLDMAIAGTAVSRGAALVTNHAAEFSRVPGLRVLGNPGKSSACALGFEHGFKAAVHFFFFDKLAALHGGKETGFFVEIAGNNGGHQPLGDGAGFSGDLGRASLAWQAKPPAPPKHQSISQILGRCGLCSGISRGGAPWLCLGHLFWEMLKPAPQE